MTTTEPHRQPAPPGRQAAVLLGRAIAGLLVPLALYYALRAADVSVYLSLLLSAFVSAMPTIVDIVRRRRINGLSAYFAAMVVGSVAVSLIAGSTEFLLAKEAVLTGVTGIWFLISATRSRPLAFAFSKPLLEGRFRWPPNFDELWSSSARWRRMWRVSSVLFGIGTLADAAARVVFAYTLPPDAVPALATMLYLATSVLLIIVTNVYYLMCGVQNPASALYRDDRIG